MENVIKNNKLFANFDGYTYISYLKDSVLPPGYWSNNRIKENKKYPGKLEYAGYLCRKHRDLDYHCNWNSLMKVVDKICDICFTDDGKETYDSEMFYRIRDCIPDINQTYKAVLEFIKLYNENK